MAHSKSAIKRIRQNNRRRLRNRSIRAKVKTFFKKADYAIKNDQEDSQEIVKQYISAIDKATLKGIYHKNYTARQKSKITKKLNSLLKK